ncbi:MAG: helix-turn-helix domain-containing protein [Pseudomonadota bacterium]
MTAPITLAQIDADALARIEARLKRIEEALAPTAGWLTIPQAASAWDVSERTVSRWASSGKIDVKGHGKLRMVRRA